jgi:hypothetical protein
MQVIQSLMLAGLIMLMFDCWVTIPCNIAASGTIYLRRLGRLRRWVKVSHATNSHCWSRGESLENLSDYLTAYGAERELAP